MATKQELTKLILLGDFDLNEVIRAGSSTTCELYKSLLDFFSGDLEHTQIVSQAAHKSRNIVYLLFTNVPHIIEDIAAILFIVLFSLMDCVFFL